MRDRKDAWFVRFVLALIAFLIAAVMIATGIAQRTILLPPNKEVASATIPSDAHYIVVPGAALRAHAGQQHISVSGAHVVFAAYGRTGDVMGWLSGEKYARLDVDPSTGGFAAPVMAVAPTVAGLTGATTPDPNGSDLWLDQRRGTSALMWTVNVPSNLSLIIASDGAASAPSTVAITWPLTVSTPFATPLIVGGSLFVLLGLALYILALLHLRRRRGPRRKPPPKMPRLPQPPKYRPARISQPTSSRGRRAVRRSVAALGAVLVGGLALTGCTSAAQATAPPIAAVSTSPRASAAPVTPPAVTQEQAQRIIQKAAAVAMTSDASFSAAGLQTRFAGPALALRTTAYAVHKKDKSLTLPQAIPTSSAKVLVILPQATTTWPRALFAIVTDSANTKVPPLALTLVQQTPRDQYQVQYEMALEPGVATPSLPSRLVGAARLAPNTTLVKLAPGKLAADYGSLLRDASSPAATLFDSSKDGLLHDVGPAAKKKLSTSLGSTAKITFTDAITDPNSIVALATSNSGALVSVSLQETWTVKPTKSNVSVKPSGATKALSGVTSTKKGIASTYGYQLLFSVPPSTSSAPVVLLGYAQGLISAKEL